jgi:hypothetical protein
MFETEEKNVYKYFYIHIPGTPLTSKSIKIQNLKLLHNISSAFKMKKKMKEKYILY